MIRLIATDLDGTVLGPDFRFRPRTLEAFAAAEEAGVDVVFVTGRPYRWLQPLREQLAYESVAICSNGAVIYDLGADRILASETVDPGVIPPLLARLRAELPGAALSAEALDGIYTDPGWGQTNVLETSPDVVRGPLEQVLPADAGVVKLLVRQDGTDPEALYERVRELAGEQVSVTHAVATLPLAEIGQAGLSKGRTLARWCAERGIRAEQVAAFGDMPNDTAMLRWAGHGYAMASGWPQVIEEVGRTCPGFEEDGVAQTIERMLAEGAADGEGAGGGAETDADADTGRGAAGAERVAEGDVAVADSAAVDAGARVAR